MTTFRMVVSFTVLCLVSVACGKGPDDPITGTWGNDSCFGDAEKPADIQQCTVKLRFTSDLAFTLTDSRQSLPATAVYPRCTTTRVVKGLQYSTDSQGRLTLTGTSSSTLERTTCANSADNQTEIADDRNSVAEGVMTYTIRDKTLSLTSGPLSGDYLRE